MATGWLKGVVKAVNSGDVLVIVGVVKSGPPPEKTLTLSSLIAPRLGRRDGSSQDEPFGQAAREFLRHKCIGQPVTFRVDYVVSQINREFGTVYVGQENVALTMVQQGLAQVRQVGQNPQEVSPIYEELLRAETTAQEAGVGLWTKDTARRNEAVRAPNADITDPASFFDKHKNRTMNCVVEGVINGGALRLQIANTNQTFTCFLAGVQCPSLGKKAAPKEGEETNGTAAAAQPEPFAREAKHFTEMRMLHRDVRVVLLDMARFQTSGQANFVGSVMKEDSSGAVVDVAADLAANGLAKVANWSMQLLDQLAKDKIRSGEASAKTARMRLWHDYVPPPSNSLGGESFQGLVIEVVSGDLLCVKNLTSGAEIRVSLSSIRAPRMGNPRRGDPGQPYSRESKEFARSRLVGQKVNVNMEYKRTITPGANQGEEAAAPKPAGEARTMLFGSVFIEDKGENGQMQRVNFAEMLVVRGLARVVKHRADDDRSPHYDALVDAESRAMKQRKGVHSSKEPPVQHINDVSQANAQKAKQYLPFFQRNPRTHAVVDYVLSGHRFKLLIPKENCQIAFALSGVRAPGKDEPLGPAAVAFARELCLQHDVEITIETIDKNGTFLGTMKVGKEGKDVGRALLQSGLCKLHPMFQPDRTEGGHELVRAEEEAKGKRIGLWENYDEKAEAENGDAGDSNTPSKEEVEVTITEVLGGGQFYVQNLSDKSSVDFLASCMETMSVASAPEINAVFVPKAGEVCSGKFSADDQWYRVLVEKEVEPGFFQVFFLDYGNVDVLGKDRLKALAPQLKSRPPLALPGELAFVKVPSVEADFGIEAAELMSSLVANKKLLAKVEEREKWEGAKGRGGTGNLLKLTLRESTEAAGSSSSTSPSVNALMLKNGLARLARRRTGRYAAATKDLQEFQEEARKARLHMWQYGDVDSDDD